MHFFISEEHISCNFILLLRCMDNVKEFVKNSLNTCSGINETGNL
jgi:hypothetical protein